MFRQQRVFLDVKIASIQKAEAAVVTAEITDVSLIFAFKQYLPELLAGLGHVIMFPFAACASLIRATLKIREAYLEKRERKGAIIRAIVETLSALTITIAVIGTFVAATTFDVLAPIFFTAALGFKTLFHLSASLYYGVKAGLSTNIQSKQTYQSKMKANFILMAVTATTTVAAGLVFIAHKATFGILGIIGGALGAVYAVYTGFTIRSARPVMVGVDPNKQSRSEFSQNGSSLKACVSLDKPSENVNTARIVKKVQIPTAEFKKRIAERQQAECKEDEIQCSVMTKKKETLRKLKATLDDKTKQIFEGMKSLEVNHHYGSHHAFNARRLEGSLPQEFPTYWWHEFYEHHYNQASPDAQKVMSTVDNGIKEYNQIIQDPNNKSLLDQEANKFALDDELKKREMQLREEQDNEEFRRRTGLTREEALEIGKLAGFGAQYG